MRGGPQPGPYADPGRPGPDGGAAAYVSGQRPDLNAGLDRSCPPDTPSPDGPFQRFRPKWLSRVFGGDDADQGLPDEWEAMLQVIDVAVDQHRVAVSSRRPGSARTTTVLGLGTALALHRRDPVVCLDLDVCTAQLAPRLGPEHGRTARDLLGSLASIHSSSDLRRFTSMARSRLEVLAAARGDAIAPHEYAALLQVLLTFRPLVLCDTGDLAAPAMREAFRSTDSLVVPMTLTPDGLAAALDTLAWWEQRAPHGPALVADAVVAVVRAHEFTPDPGHPPRGRELKRLLDDFYARQDAWEDEAVQVLAQRVRAVVPVPHDPALADGGPFVWDDLDPDTQDAWITLAYEAARGFRPAG